MEFDNHQSKIEVIPHGYLGHPSIIDEKARETFKDPNLFTMLVGDFRRSKEFIQSIKYFLVCPGLENANLQIIFRQLDIHTDDSVMQKKLREFNTLIKNPRIISICMREIPDEVIIKAFLCSHAVILPYLWGTHSGQVEMAKDCGCHVVSSDVGFYKDQWDAVQLWPTSQARDFSLPEFYQAAIIDVYRRKPIKPAGYTRIKEFTEKILHPHIKLYNELMHE